MDGRPVMTEFRHGSYLEGAIGGFKGLGCGLAGCADMVMVECGAEGWRWWWWSSDIAGVYYAHR